MNRTSAEQKRIGAWYTPPGLIGPMVDWLTAELDGLFDGRRRLRILDPACGDGRLLIAVSERLRALGWTDDQIEMMGCDIDPAAVAAAQLAGVTAIHDDALARDWGGERFDIVIGNPPFLSQMAAATTRGGSSRHGGGPYADAAVEFMALAHRLVYPSGSRVVLVLPQSILAARDATAVRHQIDRTAQLAWSWWAPEQQLFDANVNICVLGWRTPAEPTPMAWTEVITDRLGIPTLDIDHLATNGIIGDRNHLNANFRDEYYALVPAVFDSTENDDGDDDRHSPPLVTSGLIDPGQCLWGEIPVRFAKRRFQRPRVDLSKLEGRFPAWATRKLVPKVLVANQTSVIEAVADPNGEWLPGVPVTSITPNRSVAEATEMVWQTAAVLTSPIATAFIWQHNAGTGLSTRSVRIGPTSLAAIPWPTGDLTKAVAALRTNDISTCAKEVCHAYNLQNPNPLLTWWTANLPRMVTNRLYGPSQPSG